MYSLKLIKNQYPFSPTIIDFSCTVPKYHVQPYSIYFEFCDYAYIIMCIYVHVCNYFCLNSDKKQNSKKDLLIDVNKLLGKR